MNEGKDENDYNEAQARDLADYLLANDIPIFEKFTFIPLHDSPPFTPITHIGNFFNFCRYIRI